MIRLLTIAAALSTTLACGPCEEPVCTAWVNVTVVEDTWREGVYALSLTLPDGTSLLDCTLGVPVERAQPTQRDVECNDVVVKAGLLEDTYGPVDPTLVELRVPVPDALDRPPELRLVLTHTAPEAQATPLLDQAQALTWTERRPPSRTCEIDCANAHVMVEVPAP